MSEPLGTWEERYALYRDGKQVVDDMVRRRTEHEKAVPGCGGAPLCMGPEGMIALTAMHEADCSRTVMVLLVAIGELAEARRRLDAQRDATVDYAKRLDKVQAEARAAEEGTLILNRRLEQVEGELADALGQLSAMDDLTGDAPSGWTTDKES